MTHHWASKYLVLILTALLFFLGGCEKSVGGSDTSASNDPEVPASAGAATTNGFDAQIKAAMDQAKSSSGQGAPVVWTISDNDTDIHIFGTVHLLRPDLEWKNAQITSVINAADTIVFEADTRSQAATQEIMGFIAKKGMFQDGTRLSSLLTEQQLADLEVVLESLGMPLGAIEPMRPWFAAIQISVLQITKSGYDPESGVEFVIEDAVKGKGKAFDYLETVDQQLGLIADLPYDDQIEFLMSSIAPANEGIEYLDLLVSEWADGDVAGISALMSNEEIMGEAIYDALLVERNKRWVPQIANMLETPGTQLVAVGAGHLAGEDSVIELLRDEGFDVTGP